MAKLTITKLNYTTLTTTKLTITILNYTTLTITKLTTTILTKLHYYINYLNYTTS